MKCAFRHQRAYDKTNATPIAEGFHLWCPDCKRWLSQAESFNVILRMLRKVANVPTSEEQLDLEREPKP